MKKIILKSRHDNGSVETFPNDYTKEEIEIIKKVKPFTLTSHLRIIALLENKNCFGINKRSEQ